MPARFVVRRRRILNFASFYRISNPLVFRRTIPHSRTAAIETLGTRPFVCVLGALAAACGGPTAAFPGYAPDVIVSPQRATLVPGSTIRLTAVGPTHAFNWISLNRGVATVDSFGTVRAVALGVALIVAAGGDSGKLADTATVAVDPPLRSLASVHHLLVGVAVDMNAFHRMPLR